MEKEEMFNLIVLFTQMELVLTGASLYPPEARRCLERSGPTWRKLQDTREAYMKTFEERFGISYYDEVLAQAKAKNPNAII